MRSAVGLTAILAVLIVTSACSPKLEVPPGAKVSCASASECPSGGVCHAGYCVDPGRLDTVPPDLAAAPVVTPSLGRSGTSFTVSVTATEDLAVAPTVILGLEVPVEVPCTAVSGRSYACTYVATGAENGGAGGTVAFDVRLVDPSMNEVVKRIAGTMRLDFRAPDVLPGSGSLVLGPPSGSPLRTVAAAGSGSTIHVAFTVDEALAFDPVVAASGAGTTLTLGKLSEAGESYLYEAVLADTSVGQGAYAVGLTLTDAAGNVATRTLGLPGAGLVVDTVAPGLPATAVPGAILYRRIPWGSQATAGEAVFDVTGIASAVEAGAIVQVFDGPAPASAAELGRGQAAADGSFGPIAIGRADHAAVHVCAVDAAGNRSGVAAVRDVRWVASLGRKIPGSTMDNPTILVSTPSLADVPAQDPTLSPEPDEVSLRAALFQDGASLGRAGTPHWAERGFTVELPIGRSFHAMAYDSDRGKVVVFGGWSNVVSEHQDLWEWDGASGVWTNRTAAGLSPPATRQSLMVYDQRRGRMMLFVGDDGAGRAGTWEWNPATGYWLDRSPAAGLPSPPARNAFGMAYDAGRGTVVLFGGQLVGAGATNDTWEWDGAAGVWTERLPEGAAGSPAARHGPALAYDAVRRKVVLWGGFWPPGAGETWDWDGDAGSWTFRSDVAGPPTRGLAAMAYDSGRSRLVFWGGEEPGGIGRREVWEWDPSGVPSWFDRTPPDALPCAYQGARLVHDALRQRSVLFGGYANACPDAVNTRQVWDWAGDPAGGAGAWIDRTAGGAATPGPRRNHALAYDPVRHKVVLYGGEWDGGVAGAQRMELRSDTWELDLASGSWVQLVVTPTPGPRSQGAMAYDPVRRAMILFGGFTFSPERVYGFDDQTWQWDGTAWTRLTPASSPSPRMTHALVSTERAGTPRLLLFGGGANSLNPIVGTTWEWDGAASAGAGNWTDVTPANGPGTRWNPALAWDADRRLAVLYGGSDSSSGAAVLHSDLWTWDGSSWTSVAVSSAPPVRSNAPGLVYDPSRRKLLLWGGQSTPGLTPLADVWEWDAASGTTGWTERTPTTGAVPARIGMGAYYDPVRRAPAMIGGDGFVWERMRWDAWEWASGADTRPAFVWTVPWSATGERRATLLGIEVTASAAGTGNDSGYPAASTAGAALLGWDHLEGGWKTLAWNGATGAPAALTYQSADPSSADRIVAGSMQSIVVAIAPLGSTRQGTALPQVTLDLLELAVTYRRAP